MSRKKSVFTLLLLGALGLLAVSSATGASEARKPAPRVGVSGTIGPVCGRNHGDGTLRFIRLGQHCKKGETYFYLHVRFKANPKGLRGAKGFPGPQGAQGVQGIAGIAGAKGETGVTGAQGEKGVNGTTGVTGADGRDGANGSDGTSVSAETSQNDPLCVSIYSGLEFVQDICSIKGGQGDKGDPGLKGDKGDPGLKGDKGDPGLKGDKGDPGLKGDKGDPGDIGSIETVAGNFTAGEKTITVNCPVGKHAVSGGYNIQGSVTANYRSDSTGDPLGTTSWTVTQTSGNTGSGIAYVYCA